MLALPTKGLRLTGIDLRQCTNHLVIRSKEERPDSLGQQFKPRSIIEFLSFAGLALPHDRGRWQSQHCASLGTSITFGLFEYRVRDPDLSLSQVIKRSHGTTSKQVSRCESGDIAAHGYNRKAQIPAYARHHHETCVPTSENARILAGLISGDMAGEPGVVVCSV